MPVVGLIHPVTRKKVPFDYFTSPEAYDAVAGGAINQRPAVPPWQGELIRTSGVEDPRHVGYNLTVSGLYACPREKFIQALYEYWVNPWKTIRRDKGSLGHIGQEAMMPEPWQTEVVTTGKLFGVDISGRADGILPSTESEIKLREIMDGKFPLDGNSYFRKDRGGVAEPHEAVQLNALRLLFGQDEWDVSETLLTIWNYALGTGRYPTPPEGMRAPHMDENDMKVIRPFGYDLKTKQPIPGTYNVGQIVELHAAASEEFKGEKPEVIMETPADRDAIVAKIPLVGERMMGGSKCETYCDVADVCTRLVREHGKPACLADGGM